MYYCVRCGDKIDKDELVCDKCGLRFTVVNGEGNLVYVNMSPTPKKKKKKKKLVWLYVLLSIIGVIAAFCVDLVSILTGVTLSLAAGILAIPDPEPIQVNVSQIDPENTTVVTPEAPIVFVNDDSQNNRKEIFDDVLRDPFVQLKGDGTDTVTVMVYMNGSDLESEYGYATNDLKEMLSATLSDNVNVVIQTGGTRRWKTSGISSDRSQRFEIKNGQLVLVDDSLSQLDITEEQTLEDFLDFCAINYPADRNILILWDHGGGVVYGYGVDELNEDYEAALTIAEIQEATRNSGLKFDFIGFDACLMGGLETACALYDVSDYLVVSEDFESGNGWEYQNWLSLLGYNSSTPTTDVAKVIVDDFIRESQSAESEGILALIDLRYSRLLYKAWTDFAYTYEDDLHSFDYTMQMERTGRTKRVAKSGFFDWLYESDYTMEEYCYAVDLMALASTMDNEEASALEAAVANSVKYCSATSGDSYMTGLSVTLPYGDNDFYTELNDVFSACGFDSEYITFLGGFVDANVGGYYDWDSYDYNGWDEYDDYSYDWYDYGWDDYVESDYGWDDYEYDDEWYDWYYDDDYYYDDGYYDDCYYDDDYYYEYYW